MITLTKTFGISSTDDDYTADSNPDKTPKRLKRTTQPQPCLYRIYKLKHCESHFQHSLCVCLNFQQFVYKVIERNHDLLACTWLTGGRTSKNKKLKKGKLSHFCTKGRNAQEAPLPSHAHYILFSTQPGKPHWSACCLKGEWMTQHRPGHIKALFKRFQRLATRPLPNVICYHGCHFHCSTVRDGSQLPEIESFH